MKGFLLGPPSHLELHDLFQAYVVVGRVQFLEALGLGSLFSYYYYLPGASLSLREGPWSSLPCGPLKDPPPTWPPTSSRPARESLSLGSSKTVLHNVIKGVTSHHLYHILVAGSRSQVPLALKEDYIRMWLTGDHLTMCSPHPSTDNLV